VAVALDEPGAVVAVDEAGHGLAELVEGVVQLDPQTLAFEGADPAFGAAVGLRLAEERRAVSDPEPRQRAGEVAERYCGPQSWSSVMIASSGRATPRRRSHELAAPRGEMVPDSASQVGGES
jgi:hypothetical protein